MASAQRRGTCWSSDSIGAVLVSLGLGLLASACGSDSGTGTGGSAGRSSGGASSDGSAPAECGTTCEDCLRCPTTVEACASFEDACSNEPDCAAFRACAGETDNPATVETCTTDHPTGAAAFCAYWGCLTYSECDAVCEDAVICGRP